MFEIALIILPQGFIYRLGTKRRETNACPNIGVPLPFPQQAISRLKDAIALARGNTFYLSMVELDVCKKILLLNMLKLYYIIQYLLKVKHIINTL